ncbi:hypothetical protein GO988_04805 [Hymenobacter sp. HMF4947]|uniref:Peptidyl-prolyl cis-trans isomerase n=1 Tax=Hymenobacter ginkgonis TaxID=2682976 RepID=A0A7K1TB60_9BACT|nr:FKBP-type peptidyl-prolyl cis-trans isomerase [Hymenobacter ginkgonis]MVN75640.1 hypothetical protein [Hymenobacter ginkgonis]
MKIYFFAGFRQLLLLVLVGAAGAFTTACSHKDDSVVSANYSVADETTISKYVADNKLTAAQRQTSGLYYVPLTSNPTGTPAAAGKTVSVLYTGTFLNGTVFDASSQHGNTPIDFVLGTGQVITGWDLGIALMHKGEKSILLIPSALAYGATGRGAIPPNTVLRFDVELVDVK